MSDDSLSLTDFAADDVGEGACIRVVQSSQQSALLQASIQRQKDLNSEKTRLLETSPKLETKEPELDIKEIQKSPKKKAKAEQATSPSSLDTNKRKIIEDIFSEKKKRRADSNFEKRFFEYNQKVQEKIQALKKKKEEAEAEICTFQPKTSMTTREELKFSNFLDRMEVISENQKKKLETKQKEKLDQEEQSKSKYFKPTLTKKTYKLTANKHKTTTNLHQKLFQEFEELKKKKEAESQALLLQICSFKPKLDKRSAMLKREGSTIERLSQPLKPAKPAVPERKFEKIISQNSENIIKEKFIEEVDKILSVFETEITEEGFLQILEKGYFAHSDPLERGVKEQTLILKAWTHLKSSAQGPTKETVKDFLLSIMNMSISENKKLFFEFKPFCETRRNQRPRIKEEKTHSTFAFKPEINSASLEIANRIREKRLNTFATSKPEEVLHLIDKEKQKSIQTRKEEKESKALDECSFQPKILRGPISSEEFSPNLHPSAGYLKVLSSAKHRCDCLFDFSKIEQEKKEKIMRSFEDFEIETNMAECTFTPSISKNWPDKDIRQEKKTENGAPSQVLHKRHLDSDIFDLLDSLKAYS